MLVHGGFWQGAYDLSLMAPIAADLAARGVAVWNVEYRSLGTGGGYPATFDDVALALDWLSTDAAASLGVQCSAEGPPLAVVGHSAGGHLAAWLALRPLVPSSTVPGPAGPRGGLRPRIAVAQAGVVDLLEAYTQQLGGGVVRDLLGTAPPDEKVRWKAFANGGLQEPLRTPTSDAGERYRAGDPSALVRAAPAGALEGDDTPLFGLVHGYLDEIVPLAQSRSFAEALGRAGAGKAVRLREVMRERHFEHLEPSSGCWREVLQLLSEAFGAALAA